MAISRRPSPKTEPAAPDVNIEALIAKGGSTPQEPKAAAKSKTAPVAEKEAKDVSFTLRIPADIAAELDSTRLSPYKVSRQSWVIEAIVQRLARERKE